ncbi:uncharacterized protein B4U79_18149 [Dinothrombium tinctorium]|uniref:Ig-like domain-containing protein n=1 Tax=Dinothrombium tinctorium TaxID=1965070 RepID=A0A3S3PV90_9ACAR|nr:uncharacterized protein B4U79_18149 [Dinothrombium tinctorium]
MNLSFYIQNDKNLVNGALNLKCLSILSQIYGQTFEELIVERNVRTEKDKYPIRVNSRNNKLIPPQINGISSRYRVGDRLQVNCSSSESYPPPSLKWIVNNKEVKENQLIRFNQNPFNLQKAKNFSATVYDNFAVFDKIYSSVLGLRFTVSEKHYQV